MRRVDHPTQAPEKVVTTPANRSVAVADCSVSYPAPLPVFELCAETIAACLAARDGGASRIEFCRALDQEGLTPALSMLAEAVERSELPVHMLLRPRAGNFVYTHAEFAMMRESMRQGLALGVSGFALGLLGSDGRINVEQTQALVQLAGGREVTFHRAFDAAISLADASLENLSLENLSLEDALEDVIRTGCRRLLTSGGATDVVAGAKALARLVRHAAGRIEIAAGGGLRLRNARAVAEQTGATHFHGSLRQVEDGPATGTVEPGHPRKNSGAITPQDVQAMIRQLSRGMRDRRSVAIRCSPGLPARHVPDAERVLPLPTPPSPASNATAASKAGERERRARPRPRPQR